MPGSRRSPPGPAAAAGGGGGRHAAPAVRPRRRPPPPTPAPPTPPPRRDARPPSPTPPLRRPLAKGAPADGRLAVDGSYPNSTTFAKVFYLTDLVFANPSGRAGTMKLKRGLARPDHAAARELPGSRLPLRDPDRGPARPDVLALVVHCTAAARAIRPSTTPGSRSPDAAWPVVRAGRPGPSPSPPPPAWRSPSPGTRSPGPPRPRRRRRRPPAALPAGSVETPGRDRARLDAPGPRRRDERDAHGTAPGLVRRADDLVRRAVRRLPAGGSTAGGATRSCSATAAPGRRRSWTTSDGNGAAPAPPDDLRRRALDRLR